MDPLRSLEKLRNDLEEVRATRERNELRIKEIDKTITELIWKIDNYKQTIIEMELAISHPPRTALSEIAALAFKCKNLQALYIDSCITGLLKSLAHEKLSLSFRASTADTEYRMLLDEKSKLVSDNQTLQYRHIKLTRELTPVMTAAKETLDRLEKKIAKGITYAVANEEESILPAEQNGNPSGTGREVSATPA